MKEIVYSAVDNGIDGTSKDNILYATFDESELDELMNKDKSKAYRRKTESIVDVASAKRQALAKLNGIDRLVLGLDNWLEDKK